MITFNLAADYSKNPSARFEDEGINGGEQLRKIIVPQLKEAIAQRDKFQIILDGTSGLGTSFLEEVFGGLIREEHISYQELKDYLVVISEEEPELIDEINQYIEDAHANED